MADESLLDVADQLGVSRDVVSRASESASRHGAIDGDVEWSAVDDIASEIWFGRERSGADRIRLQCELLELTPSYSAGMYLAGGIDTLGRSERDAFWRWAVRIVVEGDKTAANSLIYIVAVDFPEARIPDDYLDVVETRLRAHHHYGVSAEWPNMVRNQRDMSSGTRG